MQSAVAETLKKRFNIQKSLILIGAGLLPWHAVTQKQVNTAVSSFA